MATTYAEIYDLFLIQIKDWKLVQLYATSPTDFATYLKGFLILAVPSFSDFCSQSLARNDTTVTFTETLTDVNKEILSLLMVEKWLEKEIQDIRQMALHVQDKDFKTYSEAQNLKEKSEYLSMTREKISQKITEQAWLNNNWESWHNGIFYT